MDSRKGKKTRSSVQEPQKGLRSSVSASRPSVKERIHSAPAIQSPQALRDQYEECQLSTASSSNSRPHAPRHNDSDPSSSRPLAAQSSRTTESHAATPTADKPSSGSSTLHSTTNSTANLPRLNFAVVGAANSGKTTFIHCALDLKKPAVSPVSSKKMSLEGDIFVISLIEVCADHIEVAENQEVRWPKCIEPEREMPRIDGVLAVCDITDQSSVACIPDLLTPKMQSSANRQRASTSSFPSQGAGARRSLNTKVKHGRAASEITGSYSRNDTSRPSLARSAASAPTAEQPDSSNRTPQIVESPDPLSPRSPSLVAERSSTGDEPLVESDEGNSRPSRPPDLNFKTLKPRLAAALDTPTTVVNSFLEIRDVDDRDDTISSGVFSPLPENGAKESGMSFAELVDRLLSLPMSKADAKFAAIFLCLYRKFAAPAELLAAIIFRFEAVDESDDPAIACIEAQLRHLNILCHWVSEYPGDFAHPLTQQCMTGFITDLAGTREFAFAAKEIKAQMEGVSQDDDTEWACSDFARGRAKTLESFNSLSILVSSAGSTTTITDETPPYSRKNSQHWNFEEEEAKERYVRHSKTHSASSSIGPEGHPLTPVNSVEAAQRQAQLLNPISGDYLTKIQWHQFMDMPDEDIARELTRIDWLMFSSIRPRDLVRHVSLTSAERDKCKGLEHVSRMINHFNHVAFWVANMVLLRDKPKHRAKALEKFMGLAWKLRQLNNYNSLGAVTAGINGTAVYRLSQTRDLVSPQVQKDFMRLEILMSTHKSHFAYRLAWENTTSERIPFLPLHRRDIVSAEEGNKTFTGAREDRINWKKFEIMGDVIVGIQRCQGTPYPDLASRNKDVERLLLDTKFSKDDDELYERSIQVEPSGAGESYRKKFNWFQR